MGESPRSCRNCGAALRPGVRFCEACGFLCDESMSSPGLMPPGHGPLASAEVPAHDGRVTPPRAGHIDPSGQLAQFRVFTVAAGILAIAMILIELKIRVPILILGWIGSGILVAVRSLRSIPTALGRGDFARARQALLLPAVLNIITLGVLPGLILLAVFFRSDPRRIKS